MLTRVGFFLIYTRRYSLMCECWSFRPKDRPSFSTIVNNLQDVLSSYEVSKYSTFNLFSASAWVRFGKFFHRNSSFRNK